MSTVRLLEVPYPIDTQRYLENVVYGLVETRRQLGDVTRRELGVGLAEPPAAHVTALFTAENTVTLDQETGASTLPRRWVDAAH